MPVNEIKMKIIMTRADGGKYYKALPVYDESQHLCVTPHLDGNSVTHKGIRCRFGYFKTWELQLLPQLEVAVDWTKSRKELQRDRDIIENIIGTYTS